MSQKIKCVLGAVIFAVAYLGAITLLFLWVFGGCMPAMHWTPVCRHYAMVEASVAHEAGFPVRIAVGEARTEDGSTGERHATGQAWISGEWIDMEYWHGYVIPSRRPELRTVDKVYTLEQWARVMDQSGWEVR